MKPKSYKLPDFKLLMTDNEPIIYGGKIYFTELNILMEKLANNPVQFAALYKLKRMEWSYKIENPLGELIFSIYNTETSYDKNMRGSIREDMENQAYDLRLSTIEESNDFLFAQYKELEPEEETAEIERIANELLSAKDEVEIRDVLIYDLLYEAMKYNLDDWPPP
jgi:hypothetical protein